MKKNIDKIYLSEKDVDNLLAWKNKNSEAIAKYKNVLEEGAIVMSKEEDVLYFQASDEENLVLEYYEDNELMLTFVCKRLQDRLVTEYIDTSKEFDKKKFEKDVDVVVGELFQILGQIYVSVMAYMAYYKPEFVEKDENIEMSESRLKRVQRSLKYNPNRTIKLVNKIYRINDNAKYKKVTKKEITRHLQAWGVRGFFRNQYGKQVWVKPHIRGKGKEEVIAKTYKIDIVE
jgi:hypothetical protein